MIPSIYPVKIHKISLDPDRFGRLAPVVAFGMVPSMGGMVKSVRFNDINQFSNANISIGDIVELICYGPAVKIGRVLNRTAHRPQVVFNLSVCRHCTQPLTRHRGQYYCQGENCPAVVYHRVLYATHQDVLDLPFGHDIASMLVLDEAIITTLPSLFYLKSDAFSSTTLGSITSSTLIDCCDVDVILDAIETRLHQLFGHGYTTLVQRLAQQKFLQALSLYNLHGHTLRCLVVSLNQDRWIWEDLPNVLTDARYLYQLGVEKTKIADLVHDATHRIIELDALSREF